MAKPKSDDQIFRQAKQKLGKMIDEATNVADVVKLCETLAKMKEVELEAEEGGYGGNLGGST